MVRRHSKARRIRETLQRLYPEPPMPLAHTDPFTLLVAVALSAQTTDARVNAVTPALFARAATPQAMAALAEEELLACVRTCGLAPTKARRLKEMAAVLVAEHGGEVPRDLAALEALPGVGHKTASVVLSQAFGQPAFPVDTHVHRLAARWGLSDGSSVARTERDLTALWPPEDWGRLHLQMISFGREHCPARGHRAADCPICSWAAPGARRRLATAAVERARRANGGEATP
jgi:endonuclease-3